MILERSVAVGWSILCVWSCAVVIMVGTVCLCATSQWHRTALLWLGIFPALQSYFNPSQGKQVLKSFLHKTFLAVTLSAPLFVPGFRTFVCRSSVCGTWVLVIPYFPCHNSITLVDFFYTCISELHVQNLHLCIFPAFLSPALLTDAASYVQKSFLSFNFQCVLLCFMCGALNSVVFLQRKKPLNACKDTATQ